MNSPIGSLPDPTPVVVDGVTVMTYELGAQLVDPEGEVVFCHGTPWSAQVWEAAARCLAERYRVHLWDMPGYGRSIGIDSSPVDLRSQMDRLARLLRVWNIERPHVVAHDIGGAVALGAHLVHGCDFASLYLWDVVTLDPWGSPFFRLVADNAEVFTALPLNLHAALVREYIAGAANHGLDADWISELSAPWLTDAGRAAFYRQIASLRPEDTRPVVELLGEVRCRTAIGWGEHDPWIPVEQASRLAESVPNSPPVRILDKAGHLAPIEAPEQVLAALNEWLGRR